MIKIQEHINNPKSGSYLKSLAESHWENLNPKVKDGSYKSTSLIEKCSYYYTVCTTQPYIDKYANKSKTTAQRHKKFFTYLRKYKYHNLKRIILSKPKELEIIKKEILQILKVEDFCDQSGNKPKLTKFGELLTEIIFNYKRFRASDFCKKLFLNLDFESSTCPYCNDNKLNITTIKSNSSAKTLHKAYLDLDHFFSKVHNPFFALSFYNLIPSCHDCNSSDKRDIEFKLSTHIHPYLESFDAHYLFKISLVTLLGDPVDEINILNKLKRKKDKTIEDIKLPDRYHNNLRFAKELVRLFMNNKHHIGTVFEASFKELLLRDIPIERKNILRYQRAKMNRDILRQIDISAVLGIK